MANHLTETDMHIKLLPLDYNILVGLGEMSNIKNEILAEPIIKSLLEQLNTKIKEGDINDIRNFSIIPYWYSFKEVKCKQVYFNLNYISNKQVYLKKLNDILSNAYPTAAIRIYDRQDDKVPEKHNVELLIAFREDGKLLKYSDY